MANAFKCKSHAPNYKPGKFDQYYVEVQLVDSVKKIGEGDTDFVIVKKEVITKHKIDEVIEAQAADVGIDNLLKKVAITGDTSLIPQGLPSDGTLYDVTGMPQDLIEAENYFKAMKAKFDALPESLKNGRDFAAFMATINQKQFDDYIASLQPNAAPAKEGDAQ